MGVGERVLAVTLLQAICFLLLKSLTCKGWPNSRRCQHEENLLEKHWELFLLSAYPLAKDCLVWITSYFLVKEIPDATAYLFQ